jgi:hypothetical protein
MGRSLLATIPVPRTSNVHAHQRIEKLPKSITHQARRPIYVIARNKSHPSKASYTAPVTAEVIPPMPPASLPQIGSTSRRSLLHLALKFMDQRFLRLRLATMLLYMMRTSPGRQVRRKARQLIGEDFKAGTTVPGHLPCSDLHVLFSRLVMWMRL